MNQVKLGWLFIALMGTVYGMEDSHKHSLKCNMLHLYDEIPGEVDNLADMSNMYVKTRFGHVVGDNDTIACNGFLKLDPSYDEIRFEINYLF